MTDYLFIDYATWGDIMDGLVSQLKRLKEMSEVYKFTHVYAPPRGGLPIAVHLSHHLNIEIVYDFDLNYPSDGSNSNDNLLVIDDVVDTGKTFNNIKEVLDNIIEEVPTFQYKLAAIHYKPRAIVKPEIYLQEIPDDTWIVYPWEKCDDCEDQNYDFQKRRFNELKDQAIQTKRPVLTATQKAAREEDRIIWRSFLHANDE